MPKTEFKIINPSITSEITLEIERLTAECGPSEIASATTDWLNKVCKKTRGLSSISHHLPSVGHFSRHEAHSIFVVTAAIIQYRARATQDG